MRKSNFSYWFTEALHSIKMNGRSSVASFIAIIACLVLIGSMHMVSDILIQSVDNEARRNEYLAYVDDSLTDEEAYALQSQILAVPNVAGVKFISRETAKKEFADFLDSNTLDTLPSTIFRHRYSVEFIESSLAEETTEKILNIKGICKVNGETDVSVGLSRIRNSIRTISTSVTILLIGISIIIVSNTISSSLQYRKSEIDIMRLCGVMESHIRIPSIIESTLIGMGGAIVAFFLQWILYKGFYSTMKSNNLISLLNIPIFSHYAGDLFLFNMTSALFLSLVAGMLGSRNAKFKLVKFKLKMPKQLSFTLRKSTAGTKEEQSENTGKA